MPYNQGKQITMYMDNSTVHKQQVGFTQMKLQYSKIPLAKENGDTESQVTDKEKRTKNNGSWRRKFHEMRWHNAQILQKTENKKVTQFANKW